MSSHLSSCNVCPISSSRSRHSSKTKKKTPGCVDNFPAAHSSGFRGMTAVLLSQSLARHLSMPHSILWPLSLEPLNGVVGGASCCRKQRAPDILVRLWSFVLSDGIKRRGVGAAQCSR